MAVVMAYAFHDTFHQHPTYIESYYV